MDAIGIGDLHLTSASGHGAWSKYYPGDSDTAILNEAQKAVNYGLERGITNVFLYGDVCDSPKMSYQAHEALYNFFSRNHQCEFYVILGNHEILTASSSHHSLSLFQAFHSALPNVHIFVKSETVKIDGALVQFLPFPEHSFSHKALNVCHIDVAGSTMDSGMPSKSDIDPEDYVIVAGHIHTSGQVKHCYYSGTMIQTNFGESEQKYFHLIHFNSSKDYEIRLVPTHPEFILRTKIINSNADIDDALQEAKNSKNKIVWRLIVADGCDVDLSSLDLSSKLNIAQVKSYKTKKDLQDLASGSIDYVSIDDIKPEDVFNSILESREDISSEMREKIKAVRKRILNL